MKKCLLLLWLLIPFTLIGQSFRSDVKAYQAEQNQKFKKSSTSPLKEKDVQAFKKLKFFKKRKNYRVVAEFLRAKNAKPFTMTTTTDRKPVYEKYGELRFVIKGKSYMLNVYQSHDARKNPLYRNHLFLPFKDLTNGKKSYGGGRFIDLRIPKGDTVTIDFNKSYNPYCAYNEKYSCPIVPVENHLQVAIPAGVKGYEKH